MSPLVTAAIIAGAVLLSLGFLWLFILKCYKKCEMDEALIRTGMGGPKVAIQGGMFVFKTLHEMQRVTLRTMQIDLKRGAGGISPTEGDSQANSINRAVRTSDFLPVIIDAEIYVHVPPNKEYVMAAARTLGESIDPKLGGGTAEQTERRAQQALEKLVDEKAHSAISGVVATMSINELFGNRIQFTDAVTDLLENDLKENGLEVESVSLEHIEQIPLEFLEDQAKKTGNKFDMVAVRTLVEANEQQETLKNAAMNRQKLTRENQDTEYFVGSQKLDEDRVSAEENRNLAVENKRVKIQADIESFEATTNKQRTEIVEQSNLDANKKIEESARDLEIYQAECEKEKAVTAARYEKEYHTEELERDRAIEMLEEEVNESIATAAINRVQSIGQKASQSKELVGIAQLNTEKAIAVASEEVMEAQEVREQERMESVTQREREVELARVATNNAKADAAQAEEAIDTKRREEKLRQTTVLPAEMEKLAAEQQRDARITLADAMLTEAERQRDADIAKGLGAEGVLAMGRAEAEAQRLENEADLIQAEANLISNGDQQSIATYFLSKNSTELAHVIPQSVEAAFKPLENIDGMKIIQVNSDGDNSDGSVIGKLMKTATQAVPAGELLKEIISYDSDKDHPLKEVLVGAIGAISDFGKASIGDIESLNSNADKSSDDYVDA